MDKEKVKMLQEVLGYFQEMQENNTLVEIAFKTSDGNRESNGFETSAGCGRYRAGTPVA